MVRRGLGRSSHPVSSATFLPQVGRPKTAFDRNAGPGAFFFGGFAKTFFGSSLPVGFANSVPIPRYFPPFVSPKFFSGLILATSWVPGPLGGTLGGVWARLLFSLSMIHVSPPNTTGFCKVQKAEGGFSFRPGGTCSSPKVGPLGLPPFPKGNILVGDFGGLGETGRC